MLYLNLCNLFALRMILFVRSFLYKTSEGAFLYRPGIEMFVYLFKPEQWF